ncbi:hypothetical protein K8I61_02905 [bacterium]|nr:hypothetical protein [bacterium]
MWYKSLLLHPFANRWNFAYMALWAIACGADPGPSPLLFYSGLAVEIGYIATRLGLEFSGRPLFQLRFLKKEDRERYFRLRKRVGQVESDLKNVGSFQTLLEGHIRDTKRMSEVFLELLILRSRIDSYVRGIHENYDQKIAELKSRLPAADGEVKKMMEQNLQIYEQRRAKYFEVMEKRAVLEARLDTIENTLNLLGDYAMGMAQTGTSRDELSAQAQIDLLIDNIKDAEMFVSDVKTSVPQSGSLRVRVRS